MFHSVMQNWPATEQKTCNMQQPDVLSINANWPATVHAKALGGKTQMFQSIMASDQQPSTWKPSHICFSQHANCQHRARVPKRRKPSPLPELLDPYSFFQELHLQEVAIVDPAVLVRVHAADLVLHLVPYGNSHLLQPVYHILSWRVSGSVCVKLRKQLPPHVGSENSTRTRKFVKTR